MRLLWRRYAPQDHICSIWAYAIPVLLRIRSILIEQVFPHLHHVAD